MKKLLFYSLLFFISFNAYTQFYNGVDQAFGKNRVQYKQDWIWSYFSYEKYDVYFYRDGRILAENISAVTLECFKEVEKELEFQLSDRIEILAYNSYDDFKQSNIGLTMTEMSQISGKTRVSGTKVFVYNTGDYNDIKIQIKEGLVDIAIKQMMLGSNWKQRVSSASLSELPIWYTEGLKLYVSNGWDDHLDNVNKNLIYNNTYKTFFWNKTNDAATMGAALWNYVDYKYGRNAITNILYTTRITRNPLSGFLYVIGQDLTNLLSETKKFYFQTYMLDDKSYDNVNASEINFKKKKGFDYYGFTSSSNQDKFLYVRKKYEKYKLFLAKDINKPKKKKKLLKHGFRLERIKDNSVPIAKFHPSGNFVGVVFELKGEIWFYQYDIDKRKYIVENKLKGITKLTDFNYSADGKKIVFSAIKNGYSDIFIYQIAGNGWKQVTNDPFSDFTPSFSINGNSVLYSSNRQDDTIRRKYNLDVFSTDKSIFKIDIKGNNLEKISESVSATSPKEFNNGIVYLDSRNGISNVILAERDSAIKNIDTTIHFRYFYNETPLTNFKNDVRYITSSGRNNNYSFSISDSSGLHFYNSRITSSTYSSDLILTFNQKRIDGIIENTVKIKEKVNDKTELEVIEEKPYFIDEVNGYEKEVIQVRPKGNGSEEKDLVNKITSTKTEKIIDRSFKLSQTNNYFINFTVDESFQKFDFTYLNQSYQRYNPSSPSYVNPGFQGLLKWGISDLFDNHKLLLGATVGTNLRDHEILLIYQKLDKRLDQEFVFYNSTVTDDDARNYSYQGKYNVSYPFNEVLSFKIGINYRYDNLEPLSIDDASLNEVNSETHNLGAISSLVYDNSKSLGLNLTEGVKFKIFAEYFKEINVSKSNLYVVGLDYRKYLRLFRNVILAGRFAASSSFGDRKLLYYLGGVDNWLGARDANTQVDNSRNFYFQTNATPVRGFWQNIRNGSNFAVANLEFRFPLISTFSKVPISSPFYKHLQLVSFFDAGLAWNSNDPYSEDNSFNTTIITKDPLRIVLENQKEPIVYGYGLGLRSQVLGYFMKMDLAWGVDDGIVLDPVFYYSISLDF